MISNIYYESDSIKRNFYEHSTFKYFFFNSLGSEPSVFSWSTKKKQRKAPGNQLYKTADLHFEIRKAAVQHLNNHPEYFIESISDNKCQSYLQQVSTSGTWCGNIII